MILEINTFYSFFAYGWILNWIKCNEQTIKKKIFFMLELTEIAGKEHFEYSLSGEFKS